MADYLETFSADEEDENPFEPKTEEQMLNAEAQARARQAASRERLKQKKSETGETAGSILGGIAGTIAAIVTGNPKFALSGLQAGKTIGKGVASGEFDDTLGGVEDIVKTSLEEDKETVLKTKK